MSTAPARDPAGRFSSKLQHSLETQLRAKGHTAAEARELSTEIMTDQGTLDPKTGELTTLGRYREAMGRKARRIDNVARATGHNRNEIGYINGKAFVK